MIQNLKSKREEAEEGFTLIELLISIVVVGILAAVVIVGINGLTSTGSNAACRTSADAASAAAAVHYANSSPNNVYPTTLKDMTATTPPELVPPAPQVWGNADMAYTFQGWTLTMSYPVAGGPPAFKCT